MIGSTVLALDHIAKRFGAAPALSDAKLHVAGGSLHALLGENGAGKTTLMRIAFGLEQPDSGVIAVRGVPVRMRSPLDAIGRGIGMVHQHFTLVPALTVAENVALGGRGPYHPDAAAQVVRRIGADTGLVLDPQARAGDLPVGAQQRLEIIKALARSANILVLDEPTAVLTPAESDELLALLKRFTGAGGAVVLITHKLREALGAADSITVLRQGRTVWTGTPGETNAHALVQLTVGELTEISPRGRTEPGDVLLAARGVDVRDARGALRVRGVSLEVRGGEVLGVAGVDGAGQNELLRVLAGRVHPAAGEIQRPARLGFIPEDRQRDALVLPFTLTENVALRDVGARRGRMPWPALADTTDAVLRRFDVRPARASALASSLSGGNQQRLVLGRELANAPAAVIAENPTRGLDVAATQGTHEQLLAARDRGAAVVLYSSDLDEVLALADRVIVMFAGTARPVAAERDAVALALLGGAP